MNKILITIEGGLGKHIIFTALARELKEKYKEVYVVSPYPDIMQACKYIDKSFQFGYADLTDLVYDNNCIVNSYNPYSHPDFIKKKLHILEAWSDQLNIKTYNSIPIINTDLVSPEIKKETDKIIKNLGQKYIVVQMAGGQSPITNGVGEYKEVLSRNYPFAQNFIDEIYKKYPDYKILNFSLPNEPKLNNTISLQAPYIFYFNIVKNAFKVFTIDSSLQHISASVKKQATVIWGETKPEHFGWKLHNNIIINNKKGVPYFNALGRSTDIIEFPSVNQIVEI